MKNATIYNNIAPLRHTIIEEVREKDYWSSFVIFMRKTSSENNNQPERKGRLMHYGFEVAIAGDEKLYLFQLLCYAKRK